MSDDTILVSGRSITVPCPFCKGTYTLGQEARRPGESETTPVVTHSMPPCQRFMDEPGALQFAVAARKAKES